MSLYEGLGLESKDKGPREKPDIMKWSSGIKLLQSQLQLKKAALTQAKREQLRKVAVLPPVVDLKSRKEDQDEMPPPPAISFGQKEGKGNVTASLLGGEWDVRQEYDPMWPNDYEKIMKDKRDRKDRDRDRDRERDRDRDRDRDRERERDDEKRLREDDRERWRKERIPDKPPRELDRMRVVNEDEEMERVRRVPNPGAAIAPPPSLMEPAEKKEFPHSSSSFASSQSTSLPSGSSVAARIMAKYGFKEGQGLGKQEQGMSQALQVEKTSKRGGKIIHEKDIPKVVESLLPPQAVTQPESITEIMKNPSKVVLLKNMVGPGEVDEELEPETKEECGKYGDVARCLIFEIPGGNVPDEEAVRIFIEFRRLESAIKAVVDLNGRYFGGRVVRASFYDLDKFKRLELVE